MKCRPVSLLIFVVGLVLILAVSGQSFAAAPKTLDKSCYAGLQSYVNGDFKAAKKLFEKVANKKEACSQFQLGMMYYYGHGIKKNVKKAKFWLKKASKNGFLKASEQLKNI